MKKVSFFAIICILLLGTKTNSQSIEWNSEKVFTTQALTDVLERTSADTLIIQTRIQIDRSVQTPKDLHILFSENGILQIMNEQVKVVFNGPVSAGRSQIFDLSAKGVTSYDTSSVSNITFKENAIYYPEWWGWLPNIIPVNKDGGHPNSSFFRYNKDMMLDIAASGGGELQFEEGVYYMRDIFIDFDNCTVSGKGKKTILRFDRDNFLYTTRRGGLFTIQGPTLEQYQEIGWEEGKTQNGNFPFTEEQRTIENIIVKDLSIEWNETAASIDPTMNGLSVVNAKDVLIENVHINLFGANRAFYIGSLFDGDVTENVTIKNCTGINLRTGVLLSHGYDRDYTQARNNKSLADITVENNNFKMVRMPAIDTSYNKLDNRILDKYSSGIFFIGNEPTSSFEENGVEYNHHIGTFTIKNNTFENADYGVKSGFGDTRENRDYNHDVVIEGNTFSNFTKMGIMSTFANINITGNTFRSEIVDSVTNPIYIDNQEDLEMISIFIAMAPWSKYKREKGPENVIINQNRFIGCNSGISTILIQPTEESEVEVTNNTFNYEGSCPQTLHDIEIETSRRKFRTKKTTVVIGNNSTINSNQSSERASVFKNSRRKKHITLIEK